MFDRNTARTIKKFKFYRESYERYLYRTVAELACEISELPAPNEAPEAAERFVTAPPNEGWRPIGAGERWGERHSYAWFRCSYTVTAEAAGKRLLLLPNTDALDTLLFINGKPAGLFDVYSTKDIKRIHDVQPLPDGLCAGDRLDFLLECYVGNIIPGVMPHEGHQKGNVPFVPGSLSRTYRGVRIVEPDMLIGEFLLNHTLVCQLLEHAPREGALYARAVNAASRVFAILPQYPWETGVDFREAIAEATALLRPLTTGGEYRKSEGYFGIIGHSHLDTAWLWPVRETLHKAARTFSNALGLMDRYPDYHFMQSSVVYLDWMREHYPDIYDRIKARVAEGRWEPNGGAWVEFDNNLPGGEFIIRQFLYGQRYTRDNLGYLSDAFWEPDTFGYSAALPQILQGCGIKYFLTTKIGWNDTNSFPLETFIWRGIDGSAVLTHFPTMDQRVDPSTLIQVYNGIKSREVADMKLLAYGFGDGGGGPSYAMQEYAERTAQVPHIPYTEPTTVSAFMQKLEAEMIDPPVYSGELYLEFHRGTLTSMHDIKRSNRMLERAIRRNELLNVMLGKPDTEELHDAIRTLLINQFHDILPGSSIKEVNDVAVHQNYRAIDTLTETAAQLLASGDEGVTMLNTLSWQRDGQVTVADTGRDWADCVIQRYTDLDGNPRAAVGGISLAPMSAKTIAFGEAKTAACPFTVDGERITTPYATVTLRDGTITSYICRDDFEAVRDPAIPFNTLYFGDDIPSAWDNWNIDYDQKLKMKPITHVVSQEIVSLGALQLRIRVVKAFGVGSTITQDIVFYADDPRIDFETVVDWQEKHALLKAGFDADILANTARFETQFGHLTRATHENTTVEKAQFEVCCHKWTDLSDSRFGVAVLNDCKYGVSVKGSDIRLSLHKGGTHPDPSGDRGRHHMTYSLLVHEAAFSTESVIRPAYELNYPVFTRPGTTALAEHALFSLDCPNVILETVKHAEDGDGIILRLYEAEGTHARCSLRLGVDGYRAFTANMLETIEAELDCENHTLVLNFKPFEIKTVYLKRQ